MSQRLLTDSNSQEIRCSHVLTPFALSCLALLCWACSQAGSGALKNAVLAKDIPIYPGATFVDSIGGATREGGFEGPVISKSTGWFFTHSASIEKVQKFYQEKLPQAKMEIKRFEDKNDYDEYDDFDGYEADFDQESQLPSAEPKEGVEEVTFSIPPPGIAVTEEEEEGVLISITAGELIITESYKPEREAGASLLQ